MKTLNCSIGTYTLKNYESFAAREGYGYNAELWKGNKLMCLASDAGRGGEIDISPNYKLDKEQITLNSLELVTDMRNILTQVGFEPGSSAGDWLVTAERAAVGMIELLIELQELAKFSIAFKKKHPDATLCFMHLAASNWFTNGDPAFVSFDVSLYVCGLKDGTSPNWQAEVVDRQGGKLRKLPCSMVRVVSAQAKGDWKLSIEEYVALHKNARALMSKISR